MGNTNSQFTEEDWQSVSLSTNLALQFGFSFVLSHTDIVIRKVLRVLRRKFSGTKTERVALGFFVFSALSTRRKRSFGCIFCMYGRRDIVVEELLGPGAGEVGCIGCSQTCAIR